MNNKQNEITEKRKFDRSTPDKNSLVHINETIYNNGTCRLSATLVDAKSKHPYGVRLKRTAERIDEIPYKEQQLYHTLVRRLHGNEKKTTITRTSASHTGSQASAALSQFRESEYACIDGWNDQTLHSVLTYFERHFLPMISEHEGEEEIDRSYIDAWKTARIEEVLGHGRSLCIPDAAAKTVTKSLKQCLRVYERMHEIDPKLPAIHYYDMSVQRHPDMEHAKSLPEDIRQNLFRLLEKLAPTAPEKVFAATLMVTSALRTGEAAAVYPSDIQFFDVWAMLPVLWQDKEGLRSKVLKTRNSYRIVPICSWAAALLKMCASYMGSIPPLDGHVLTPKKELSQWILGLLTQCGCESAFLREAQRLQEVFPDSDVDGTVNYDLAAYILRRDAASRMRNVCGFTAYELDRVLGHAPVNRLPKGARPALNTPEELHLLAQKMDRYLYDSTHKYSPLPIQANCAVQLFPFSHYRISNAGTSPLLLHVDVEAAEASEPIRLRSPQSPNSIIRRSMPPHDLRGRIVIGGDHACEE